MGSYHWYLSSWYINMIIILYNYRLSQWNNHDCVKKLPMKAQLKKKNYRYNRYIYIYIMCCLLLTFQVRIVGVRACGDLVSTCQKLWMKSRGKNMVKSVTRAWKKQQRLWTKKEWLGPILTGASQGCWMGVAGIIMKITMKWIIPSLSASKNLWHFQSEMHLGKGGKDVGGVTLSGSSHGS